MRKKRALTLTLALPLLLAILAIGTARSGTGTPAEEEPPPVTGRSSAPSVAAAAGSSPTSEAAEEFEWFFTFNGPVGGDAGNKMAVDDEGNVFVAGSHHGLDNDRDGRLEIESEQKDVFFMKMSQRPEDDGVTLEWIRSPTTPAWNQLAWVAPDEAGGAYGVGRFSERLTFGPDHALEGVEGNDGFLVRYGSDGEVLWTRAFAGPGNDWLRDVASDALGNAYIIGSASGSFPLDDAGAEFRTTDEAAPFLASYDPDGALRWIHLPSGGAASSNVEVAPNGEILLSGSFDRAVDFDGDGREDLPAPADRDGFVARFDANGALLGAWSWGGGGGTVAGPDGDLFVLSGVGAPAEELFGPADFDGDGAPDIEARAGLEMAPVIARFGPEGELRWVRSYVLELGTDLATDGERLVMTGGYHGVLDLDEDGVPERVDETVDPSLESELAVFVLSAEDGRHERVWTAPGPGRDMANGAAFLPGRPVVFVTGYIQLTADFTGDGEDGEGWATCEALGDFFFARYRLPAAEVPDECALALEGTPRRGLERSRFADLTWTGGGPTEVDVYRNGELIATVPNDGSYTDEIPSSVRGPYVYRILAAGSRDCSSNEVTVGF